jgi:hypothetical protein
MSWRDSSICRRAWNCAGEAQLDVCYVRLRGRWTYADGWRTPTESVHRLPKPLTIVNEANEAEGHYLHLCARTDAAPRAIRRCTAAATRKAVWGCLRRFSPRPLAALQAHHTMAATSNRQAAKRAKLVGIPSESAPIVDRWRLFSPGPIRDMALPAASSDPCLPTPSVKPMRRNFDDGSVHVKLRHILSKAIAR